MSDRIDRRIWIANFRSITLKTYENKPDRIRDDLGSKWRVSDDYKACVLLALVQNADDAHQPELKVLPRLLVIKCFSF